jgi:hypothetical protein
MGGVFFIGLTKALRGQFVAGKGDIIVIHFAGSGALQEINFQ